VTEREAAEIAETYRRFAHVQAHGRSPLYERLAASVADDRELLDFLAAQPAEKRQPNLLLGAVRYLFGTQPSHAAFRNAVLEDPDRVAAVLARRRTQTNEPGRCALLLPVLASLAQPLALLEVGASAGLCLLPDRYGYAYGEHRVGDGPPVLECEPHGPIPLPRRLPEVVWRAGIDVEPLDLEDAESVRWLEALVWPEHRDRLERLRTAIAVARRDPPRLVRADLLEGTEALALEAPPRRRWWSSTLPSWPIPATVSVNASASR
jgi:Uncharacterized protein conserved in bacteria (DUF2332)